MCTRQYSLQGSCPKGDLWIEAVLGRGKFLCTEAWELQLPLSLQRPCLNKETTAVPIHAVSVARYGWASSAWFFSLFSRGRDGAGGALLVLGDLSNQLDSALTADSLG